MQLSSGSRVLGMLAAATGAMLVQLEQLERQVHQQRQQWWAMLCSLTLRHPYAALPSQQPLPSHHPPCAGGAVAEQTVAEARSVMQVGGWVGARVWRVTDDVAAGPCASLDIACPPAPMPPYTHGHMPTDEYTGPIRAPHRLQRPPNPPVCSLCTLWRSSWMRSGRWS